VFGEYADRASALTVDDANGNPIPGIVNGKTQVEWLQAQLEALFKWRNALIRAEEKVRERREKIAEAIEVARKRLERVRGAIQEAARTRNRLERQLHQAQKHPKRNRALIKGLRERIKTIDGAQKPRERLRDNLKDKILPALTGKRTALNTARGDLLSSLETVQGIGSPMEVLTSLPGVGVLGGQILQVQTTLRDLQAPRETVTDTTPEGPSERESILEQLLREANLRTAVSQAQYKVFRDMPSFGGGGVVPGPAGAPRVIEAHGGEGVFTQDQMAAIGAPTVNISIAPGMEWLRRFIQVEVENGTRAASRRAGRGLPSRGGLR
jgi:hypothetical protein